MIHKLRSNFEDGAVIHRRPNRVRARARGVFELWRLGVTLGPRARRAPINPMRIIDARTVFGYRAYRARLNYLRLILIPRDP